MSRLFSGKFCGGVVLGTMVATASCHHGSPETESAPATRQALDTVVEAPAPVEASTPGPVPDLDVHALQRQLGCPNRRHARACHVLHEFAEAKKVMGQATSGEGRWFGHAYRVEKGSEKGDMAILAASNVPSASVGPTDLPFRVAMGTVPKENRRDAGKLLRTLVHGEIPSTNRAVPFIKGWKSDNGRIAMATTGPSVMLIAEEATYVRVLGQKALVVKMKPSLPGVATNPGDGTYAELWAVSW